MMLVNVRVNLCIKGKAMEQLNRILREHLDDIKIFLKNLVTEGQIDKNI